MKILLIICLAVGLSGCAHLSSSQAEDDPADLVLEQDFNRSKLIAADFVATLAQIEETNTSNLLLQVDNPNTRFGELLLSALQKSGYSIRLGGDSGQKTLDYASNRDEQLSNSGNPVYTFIVAAGSVKLKRAYEVDQTGVWPMGSMLISGADASYVVVDDSIFNYGQAQENGVLVSAVPASETLVGSRELVAELNDSSKKSGTGNYQEFTNMYETDTSRYDELFKDYDVIDSNVLVFGNDSLILGRSNKLAIREFAKLFNPETDVMSVIGCSHGASKVENGNAYLANGRAFRVKEEFVLAGLEAQKVLEEGCWANVDFPKMPARGVLVQHRRIIQ